MSDRFPYRNNSSAVYAACLLRENPRYYREYIGLPLVCMIWWYSVHHNAVPARASLKPPFLCLLFSICMSDLGFIIAPGLRVGVKADFKPIHLLSMLRDGLELCN